MKVPHLLIFCLLFVLTSCSKATEEKLGATVSSGKFEYLPATSDVFIDEAVADSINAAIPRLDGNKFSEGRTYKQAADTLMAHNLIKKAEHSGGSSSDGTIFRKDLFVDHITVSISTEYDASSLKLLKEWERPVNKEYTESTWSYSAKIRINYTVTVDGRMYEGVYLQPSQINSPFELIK